MKEPYFGSLRFYKNLILVLVIILIAVPTIIAIKQATKIKQLEEEAKVAEVPEDISEEEAPRIVRLTDADGETTELVLGEDDEDTEDTVQLKVKAELLDYQKILPDFYAPQELDATEMDENVVYLTFDGGPSSVTGSILDALARHNAKATFFVNGSLAEENFDILKSMTEEGHTVGMMPYTENVEELVTVEDYLNDMYETYKIIKEATGVAPTAYRLPGGSVSSLTFTIAKPLMAEMLRRGFVPYDWNATSDEAIGQSTGKQRAFVQLYNDDDAADVPESLDTIISELGKQGYKFKKINPGTMPVLFSYLN